MRTLVRLFVSPRGQYGGTLSYPLSVNKKPNYYPVLLLSTCSVWWTRPCPLPHCPLSRTYIRQLLLGTCIWDGTSTVVFPVPRRQKISSVLVRIFFSNNFLNSLESRNVFVIEIKVYVVLTGGKDICMSRHLLILDFLILDFTIHDHSGRSQVYTNGNSHMSIYSSEGTPNPDSSLKNTTRTKIIYYRRLLYVTSQYRPGPIVFVST